MGEIPCLAVVVAAAAREVEVGLAEPRVGGLGETVIHDELERSVIAKND